MEGHGASKAHKNRRKERYCAADQNGVSLRNNFPHWFSLNDYGSSPHPCHVKYRGPGPLSEVESTSLVTLVDRLLEGENQLDLILNLDEPSEPDGT